VRAGAALRRAEELAAKLAELRDRQIRASTPSEQVERSRQAHDRALRAIREAAEAHHRAADVHRRLADLLESVGEPVRAAEHRQLAEADDAAGDVDEARGGGRTAG
jgi:hypothetical protein